MDRENTIYHSKNNSFYNYLSWCDEKEKVAEAINKIRFFNTRSFLDIGAGTGKLSKEIIDNFKTSTLIEPSKELVKDLKFNCPNATIINDKFENINFANKFDVILAAHVLRYLDKWENQLNNIFSLLNDNGNFILIENNPDEKYVNFYNKFRKQIFSKKNGSPTNVNFEPYLKNAGFKYKITFVTATLKIPSLDDAISFLDFIYDIPLQNIEQKIILKIREYLCEKFKNKIVFTFRQKIYICSK